MNKTLGYSVCLVLPALDNLYDSNSYREGNVLFTPVSPYNMILFCVWQFIDGAALLVIAELTY